MSSLINLKKEIKMKVSKDFQEQFVYGKVNTTIHVYYHLPDYNSIIQEFVWRTLDLDPHFPRIHQFLDHWDRNIDAPIKEAFISCDKGNFKPEFRNVTAWFNA